MRTLCLLRHAKSSWDDSSLRDHDRPLAGRGRRAAPEMGRVLAEEGLRPDLVLCSTATRTRETWALVAPLLGDGVRVDFEPELYGASAGAMLRIARAVPDVFERVLMIGHNPGTQELAVALAGSGSKKDRERLRKKLPTAAVVVLESEAERWSDVEPGTFRLERFVRPKDLPQADARDL